MELAIRHDARHRHRRGLRAPALRRHAAHPDRDPARRGRAHGLDLLRRQDLQHDRMEDRLAHRAPRPRLRDPRGQAVPHLRERGAVPAGDRRRARAARRGLRRGSPPPSPRAATSCVAGLTAAGFAVSVPQAGYFVVADPRPLGFADAADLCRRLPELAGVVGVPVSAFCGPALADGYGRSSASPSASPSPCSPRPPAARRARPALRASPIAPFRRTGRHAASGDRPRFARAPARWGSGQARGTTA